MGGDIEYQQSILVVDNDPGHLAQLEHTLRHGGFQQLRCVSSGESALSALSAFQPDLVLMDFLLCGDGSVDFCRHLRRLPGNGDVPIIFLVNEDWHKNDRTTEKYTPTPTGAVDFIGKPVRTRELLSRINTHLELKQKKDAISLMNQHLKREMNQRELAEQALCESNEKFKIISERSLLGIYIWGPRGFQYANPAFARIFDDKPEAIFHADILHLVHPEDRFTFKEKLDKLIKGELTTTHHQFRGVTRGGEEKFLEDYKSRILLKGWPVVIGTVVDITHKKIMEGVLNEKNQQLEQLNRTLEKRIEAEVERRRRQEQFMVQQSRLAAMGEMVGVIAHQWRQPLSTVAFIIENILDDIENNALEPKSTETLLNKAVRQIAYMSGTIDDFKNFFKPSKMKEDFDIVTTVRETISMVTPELEHKNIDLVFKHHPPRLMGHGFPNEFKQVLINLVNNGKEAVLDKRKKITPRGKNKEAKGRIAISLHKEGCRAVLLVRDNGSGIRQSTRARVFEPYFSTKDQGLGIGLYMSKVIIEEHMNGTLTLGDAVGGAEFILELPCLEEDQRGTENKTQRIDP